MDRVIIICILGVLLIMLASKLFKGGLGLLRIITMAMLFCLMLILISRPNNAPGLLPSLAKRIFSENSVQIAAEASGEVLTDEELSSNGEGTLRPFSAQAELPSSSLSPSPEAAFSGSSTTASSNDLPRPSTPAVSAQSTVRDPQSGVTPPPSAVSEVQSPSSTGSAPSSSTSRPINALW